MTSLADHDLAFIGAGNMAEALIRGLVQGGHVPAARIHASAPRLERLAELAKAYAIATTTDNQVAARAGSIVVLSTKPQILGKVLAEIGSAIRPGALVISICAGIDCATIEAAIPSEGVRVVRAM